MSLAGFASSVLFEAIRPFAILATATAPSPVADLYVASYAGSVTRLELGRRADGTYDLTERESTLACGANPGWLEIDPVGGALLCMNEAYTLDPPAGSLLSISIPDLTSLVNLTDIPSGPAHATLLSPDRLGIAHYSGAAVSVIGLDDPLRLVQQFNYPSNPRGPGPVVGFQERPYPHGIAVDPSGRFAVVCDRGADLLRVYALEDGNSGGGSGSGSDGDGDGADGGLRELAPFEVELGVGPRHGTFVRRGAAAAAAAAADDTGHQTFFYVIGELTNLLLGYEVTYSDSGLSFREIHRSSTYGTAPGDGAGLMSIPAEIVATPDLRHLIISVRNDTGRVAPGSDTIATYSIDADTGALALVGLTGSGGRWPRSFAVNRAGDLIAVGNQYSRPGKVVIFGRDVDTGVIRDDEVLAEWSTEASLPDGASISRVLYHEAA